MSFGPTFAVISAHIRLIAVVRSVKRLTGSSATELKMSTICRPLRGLRSSGPATSMTVPLKWRV
jgi:hypothetical protein